jgi:hypothetical protein
MKLKTLLTILSTIIVIDALFVPCGAADDARRQAAHRQRRMIFNNDGDDAWVAGAPATKEGLLSLRMDHIGDCGVDTVFYCTTMSINSFTHDSQVTEVFTTTAGSAASNRMADLIQLGTDPLKLAIEACRQRDIEIFWTLRMNDVHDSFTPEYVSQWKKDHPQFLLGTLKQSEGTDIRNPLHFWSWADFQHEEVRDVVLVGVKDVLDRYDVDGIDLDFVSHNCFFEETRRLEPVTAEHREMMTDLVGKISSEVLAAAKRRGKPILLSCRVLQTLEQCQRFGMDVDQWAERGYIDMIITGRGYDPFTMPDDLIRRGHDWGVPVYRCFSNSAMAQELVQHSDLSGNNLGAWRAAAANAWHDGADGIVTFNLFPKLPGTKQTEIARTAWREMRDPEGLVGMDKLYCIEHLHYDDYCWIFKSVPREGRLPVTINRNESVTRNLPVADDIAGLADRVQALRLRICLVGLQDGDQVDVEMNGTRLEAVPEKPLWLAAAVPPAAMKLGENELVVGFASGTAESLEMRSVELTVDYK